MRPVKDGSSSVDVKADSRARSLKDFSAETADQRLDSAPPDVGGDRLREERAERSLAPTAHDTKSSINIVLRKSW